MRGSARFFLLLLTMLAGARSLSAQVSTLQVTGDPARRLDILILGDGYTTAEFPKFASDVDQFMTGVFAQEPFHEYKNYFNVRRLNTASAESGVDHPERTPPVQKNTAFDAAYNCAGIQRLICVSNTKVLDAAAVVPPSQRDLIIVIVNDSEYGGAGGSVAVASTNVQAVELILHETGHTLAFLADEYTTQPPSCSDGVEPAEANATKSTTRAAIKWNAWIASSTVIPTTGVSLGVPGLYLGSKYCPNTLYRPTYDSKMRTLGRSYDPINTEQFVRRFYEFVLPVESRSPDATTAITLNAGQSQQFSITTPQPASHTLTVSWELNGQAVATGASYTFNTANRPAGNYAVTATVSDATTMVRTDPNLLLRQQTSWTVSVSSAARTYNLPAGGGSTSSTGGTGALTVGQAVLQQNAGAESGLALFRYRPNGVTITEAAVPASLKLSSGRIYGEVNGAVNTGLAISNPGATDAIVSFYFTDVAGNSISSGTLSVPAHGQTAKFLNESPFNAPQGFLGTLSFSASVPVGAIALRSLSNERGEFLITTLPVLDLSAPAPTASILFPHFASGAGWKTSLLLVNPGDTPLTGTLTFRNGASGAPLNLTVDGQTASTFNYQVAPRSARRLSTAEGGDLLSGSVQLVPGPGQSAPVGLIVFSYRPAGVTLSEAGVPVVAASNAFLLYAEASGIFGQPNSVQPGVALANASANPVIVTIELRNLQGQLLGQGTVTVPGNAQTAAFLNQMAGFSGVSIPYEGRLRVQEPSGSLTMVGLLGRYNERGDFLVTTTPPVPENAVPTGELVFPHFADGGGYTTKFIFLNGPSQQSSGSSLSFYSQTGQAISPNLQ